MCRERFPQPAVQGIGLFKILFFLPDELQDAIMISVVKKMNNRMAFITRKINKCCDSGVKVFFIVFDDIICK